MQHTCFAFHLQMFYDLWQNSCCKYAKISVSINQCWHRFLMAIYMHHDWICCLDHSCRDLHDHPWPHTDMFFIEWIYRACPCLFVPRCRGAWPHACSCIGEWRKECSHSWWAFLACKESWHSCGDPSPILVEVPPGFYCMVHFHVQCKRRGCFQAQPTILCMLRSSKFDMNLLVCMCRPLLQHATTLSFWTRTL